MSLRTQTMLVRNDFQLNEIQSQLKSMREDINTIKRDMDRVKKIGRNQMMKYFHIQIPKILSVHIEKLISALEKEESDNSVKSLLREQYPHIFETYRPGSTINFEYCKITKILKAEVVNGIPSNNFQDRQDNG